MKMVAAVQCVFHLLMVLKEVDKLQYQLVQQVLDRVDQFYLHLVQVLVLVKVLEALILSPVEAVLALVVLSQCLLVIVRQVLVVVL